MISQAELENLLNGIEGDRIEMTVSTTNTDKVMAFKRKI